MAVKWLKVLVVLVFAGVFFWAGVEYGPALLGGIRDGSGIGAPQPVEPGEEEYERLRELVAQAAGAHRLEPVEALYNSSYRIVVPEINGYEIDEDATLARLAQARPGEEVTPVWREIAPSVTASQYPEAVIDRGNGAINRVTLMINVAWGNEFLPEMLNVLDEYDAKTTFFPVGRWAERFPEELAKIHNRGHELGNHGYSDAEVFSDLSLQAARESLHKTNELVAELTGRPTLWFTPHKGEFNEATRKAAAEEGMRLLMWTLDTVDWQKPGAEVMANRILNNLIPGAIILMHPTEQSADFLRLLLPEISVKGYTVVTMSELLSPTPKLPETTLKR